MEGAKKKTLWLILPLGIWFFFFFLIPLGVVGYGSIYTDESGWTLKYYFTSLAAKVNLEALKNSFILAFTTTLLGVSLGMILSYLIYRMGKKGKNLLLSFISIPLTFSGLVIAYAFIVTFGSSGTLTLILSEIFRADPQMLSGFLYTWKGLALAYLYFLIPRMILTMMAAWVSMDWGLVDAAESLGAGSLRILIKVILPAIWPSVLAGSVLLFAVAMGAFATAFALVGSGVNILPLLIYTQVSDVSYNLPQANALAMILTMVTTFLIYLYQKSFLPTK
jgi:putative spermidine/putrescine transport system permease protein